MTTKHLLCPVCRLPLAENNRRLVCEGGHSFDISKSGYCNLLRSAKKSTHGDNKEMIRARRDFLSLGYYAFLADAVASAVNGLSPDASLVEQLDTLTPALESALTEYGISASELSAPLLDTAARSILDGVDNRLGDVTADDIASLLSSQGSPSADE